MSLIVLPAELIEAVLSTLIPRDILNFGRTCSDLYRHALPRLTKLARNYEHDRGFALTSGLQEVSFWFDYKSSGSILEWAAVEGQLPTFLRLLADPLMDILRRDEYGVTMLHRLSSYGLVSFIKPLLQRLSELQRDIFPTDACRLTPLHYAAGRNKTEAVVVLLEAGANVHAQDHHGNTALHLAAVTGSCAVLSLLVLAGADVTAKTRFGWTPIDQASITHRHLTVTMLQALGSAQPSWTARHNALGQFLSLSPCPLNRYNHLNDELLNNGD
jgi:ankyrin repeat protein